VFDLKLPIQTSYNITDVNPYYSGDNLVYEDQMVKIWRKKITAMLFSKDIDGLYIDKRMPRSYDNLSSRFDSINADFEVSKKLRFDSSGDLGPADSSQRSSGGA
jgi:hypothetical protein